MSPFYVVAFLKPKGSWLTCCSVLISTFTKHGRDPTRLKRRPCQRNPQRNRIAANVAGKLLIHSPYLLWMDEFAGKLPCFVGIYRGSIVLGFQGGVKWISQPCTVPSEGFLRHWRRISDVTVVQQETEVRRKTPLKYIR